MRNRFLLLLLLIASTAYGQPTATIARWQGNRQAALSITFDDNCAGQFSVAQPLLDNHNLPATFFVNPVASPCNPINWADVLAAHAAGHEIGSHSETHPHLRTVDSATQAYELLASADTLLARIPSERAITLAWPFGEGGGSPAADQRLRRIAKRQGHYIAARNAGSGTGFDAYDAYTQPFYNRPGADYYFQVGALLMDSGYTDSLAHLLRRTKAAGGWCTLLYHAIELGGYNNIRRTEFAAHLDTIQSAQAADSGLWVAPFRNIAAYHHERRSATVIVDDPTRTGAYVFTLIDSLPDSLYAEPLTVLIKNIDDDRWTSGFGFQRNGVEVDWVLAARHGHYDDVLIDIMPDGVPLRMVGELAVTPKLHTSPIVLNPNPAKTSLTLSGLQAPARLTLYDTQGRIALATIATPGTPLNVHALTRGLYAWQASGQSGRIVLE